MEKNSFTCVFGTGEGLINLMQHKLTCNLPAAIGVLRYLQIYKSPGISF